MKQKRELRIIEWERVKWQEAFPLFRGNKYICPYCGEVVKARKPWGLCLTKEERAIPRSEYPGRTVVTCPVCNIPFLKPKVKKEGA